MVYLKKKLFDYDENGKERFLATIAGLSNDSKPTAGIVSGSKFIEADTGKTYVFDGMSKTPAWTEEITVTTAAT